MREKPAERALAWSCGFSSTLRLSLEEYDCTVLTRQSSILLECLHSREVTRLLEVGLV